jgi:CHAD domain-containing protein
VAGHVEHERKFDLAEGQELPDLSGLAVPGTPVEIDLEATYYDSPDFRLAGAHMVLRRRTGGGDEGWHLKLPGDGERRTEFQASIEHRRPPQEFRQVVATALAGAPLVPVGVLRTHRSERPLTTPEGTVLALVCTDQVKARAGGHRQRWREAEIELVEGDEAFLERATAVLAGAGIPVSTSVSKAARALSPAMAEAAAADASAGAAVMTYVRAQVGVLQGQEAAVRVDAPDAVHRSRVATRRLRSALRTFVRVLGKGAVTELRSELRWHATELGAARDAEVLRERVVAALAELSVPAGELVSGRIATGLADAHAVAHAGLLTSMGTGRYEKLQLRLEAFLVRPALARAAAEPATVVLAPMLARAVERVRKLEGWAAEEPADLGRWHEVRKAAKAARYGAELLVPVLGAPAELLRARWEGVTEAFGAMQDCVLAQRVLADLAAHVLVEGLPRAPFDELRRRQDAELGAALARGREALAAALSVPV